MTYPRRIHLSPVTVALLSDWTSLQWSSHTRGKSHHHLTVGILTPCDPGTSAGGVYHVAVPVRGGIVLGQGGRTLRSCEAECRPPWYLLGRGASLSCVGWTLKSESGLWATRAFFWAIMGPWCLFRARMWVGFPGVDDGPYYPWAFSVLKIGGWGAKLIIPGSSPPLATTRLNFTSCDININKWTDNTTPHPHEDNL
jgi:hypothetical protein